MRRGKKRWLGVFFRHQFPWICAPECLAFEKFDTFSIEIFVFQFRNILQTT